MSAHGDWALGLAVLADALGRDLQRAARVAGGPERLWRASPEVFAAALRADQATRELALATRRGFDPRAERAGLRARGTEFVGLADPGFPQPLREVFDPPFGLFIRGAGAGSALARAAEGPTVAVVGSRRPTSAGRRLAHDIGHDLALRGAVVVSGLARGIDTAVHQGALDAGGVTVAVLGSGVDVVHPRGNRGLAERIAETGALVSEYRNGTPPAPWRFPARNRIVAGISAAVVVVEAGARSGALITADFALEQGRPVLAVPGWPGAELSVGGNALIRAGAAVCEGVADIVAEITDAPWLPAPEHRVPEPDGLAARVLAALHREPLRADQIAAAVEEEPAAVASALARLEMDGRVLRGEGQRYWAAGVGGVA